MNLKDTLRTKVTKDTKSKKVSGCVMWGLWSIYNSPQWFLNRRVFVKKCPQKCAQFFILNPIHMPRCSLFFASVQYTVKIDVEHTDRGN